MTIPQRFAFVVFEGSVLRFLFSSTDLILLFVLGNDMGRSIHHTVKIK
jgi:hypothetical protein